MSATLALKPSVRFLFATRVPLLAVLYTAWVEQDDERVSTTSLLSQRDFLYLVTNV